MSPSGYTDGDNLKMVLDELRYLVDKYDARELSAEMFVSFVKDLLYSVGLEKHEEDVTLEFCPTVGTTPICTVCAYRSVCTSDINTENVSKQDNETSSLRVYGGAGTA